MSKPRVIVVFGAILFGSARLSADPVLLAQLTQSSQMSQSGLAVHTITISLFYTPASGTIWLPGPTVVPGQTGFVDVPIPANFAAYLRDCQNESLYYVLSDQYGIGSTIGRMEGPHPTLATWGLGAPDLSWAHVDFARVRLNNIVYDFQSNLWTADSTWQFWGGLGCYANCDQSCTSPVLNVNDFACFLNAFASGDTYANCDHSTAAPLLNVNDFACFLNAFAAGCP